MRLIKYLKENDIALFLVFLTVSMVVVIFASIADDYFMRKKLKNKIKSFNNGHPLICSQTAFDTKYLISKEKGWYILEDYITDGNNVYSLENCRAIK